MSKIHFNINIEHETNDGALPDFLSTMLSSFAQVDRVAGSHPALGAGYGETSSASNPASEAASNVAQRPERDLASEVIAFLRSDPRFTLRTADSIREHFGAEEAQEPNGALDVLDNLVAGGMVTTKRRRGDGVTLYQAVAEADPVTTPAPAYVPRSDLDSTAPTLNEQNICSFLGSDDRYSMRSLDAITKHFANANLSALASMLSQMTEDGDLTRSTRHSDGMELYSLA